jgi:acyl-CoA synthetase (NDP forming)
LILGINLTFFKKFVYISISASWVVISNPVDMSAITRHLGPVEGNKQVVELLLQDEGMDAVVPILLASPSIPAGKYSYLPELFSKYPQKPIYVTFTVDKQSFDQAKFFLEHHSIPVFVPLEDAFETLQVLYRCREALDLQG